MFIGHRVRTRRPVADPEGGGGGVRPPPKIALKYDKA